MWVGSEQIGVDMRAEVLGGVCAAEAGWAEREWVGCAHHVPEGAVAEIVRAVAPDEDQRDCLDGALEEEASGKRSRKRHEREQLRECGSRFRCTRAMFAVFFFWKMVAVGIFDMKLVFVAAINTTVSS